MSKKRLQPSLTPAAAPFPDRSWMRALVSPAFWLEWVFLGSLIVIPLAFQAATSNSIVAKDFLAEWLALWFVLFGGWVLFWRGEWRQADRAFAFFLSAYLIYGTVRVVGSPFSEHSWAGWRTLLAATSPVLPAFLLARSRACWGRIAVVLEAVLLMVCLYAALQFLAVYLAGSQAPFDQWPRTIDPVRWPWHGFPFFGDLFRFLEFDLSYFRWEEFEGLFSLPGVCSTLGNPNFFIGFLVPLVPLVLVRAWWRKPWSGAGLFGWVLVGLVGLSFVLAGSRGGFLGIFGCGLALPIFLGAEVANQRGPIWRKAGWVVSILLAAILCGALAFLFGPAAKPEVEKGIGALENRSIVYRCTMDLIRDNWLWGVSPGVFTIRFPDYLLGENAEKYGWLESPEEKVLEHAHCEPFEVMADLGLVGLVLWGGALVAWLVWVWRGFLTLGPGRERWLLAALACGAVGFFCQDLISVSFRWTASLWMFWTVIGLAAGLASRALAAGPAKGLPKPPRRAPMWAVPVLAGVVVSLSLPITQRYTADWYFTRGRNAAQVDSATAERELLRSLELNPSFPQTPYLLAGIYYGRSEFQKAIKMYLRVQEIRGNVVVLTENMATAYMKLSTILEKDFERQEAVLTAIRLYEGSLARHPTFPRLADYLSRAYQRLGFLDQAEQHRRKAIQLYEQWLEWDSSYPRPDYALDLAKNYFLDKKFEKSFWLVRTAQRWGAPEEAIETMKSALFQVDPELRKLWDREEKKAALQTDRQPPK